tara:strand:+ start:459 stop:584 length:126 start_codon:yes stop_codon:yes gene_type:complete
MKKIYYILFSLFIIGILLSLYFIDIPSPSKIINEEFKLIVE